MLDIDYALPACELSTTYSFYPYSLSSRSHVHSTLLTQSENNSTSLDPMSDVTEIAGPSSRAILEDVRQSHQRAERRALMGWRPAGIGLAKEDDEVCNEEDILDHDQHDINMFGHRFLLPFGRRLTQMEMDAAPSPSPSEQDHERRQEDHTMASPVVAAELAEIGEEEEQDGQVDLDASIEDLDDSAVVDDGSVEEE
ncbi:uncharacterized protein IL334_006175 [Kwoniella shivajii]|uniref:Anaphase-promoting complex subunit 13 n=1 Tax=Kwoniella shivajii TaxID=564305 RepID=A0ABZ1D571_9TREE|nr:hypothetical protein IL334_006175 [Kwoniella shivajii]